MNVIFLSKIQQDQQNGRNVSTEMSTEAKGQEGP